MLFVFRNYDVQINEVGMKIMERCCHYSPLTTCGFPVLTKKTKTKATATTKTTTKSLAKVQQRYAVSLQQRLVEQQRAQFLLKGLNFNNNNKNNNSDIKDEDTFILNIPRDIFNNIKYKKQQKFSPSVLRLHRGSLFKKKFIGGQGPPNQGTGTRGHKDFLTWHLSLKAI